MEIFNTFWVYITEENISLIQVIIITIAYILSCFIYSYGLNRNCKRLHRLNNHLRESYDELYKEYVSKPRRDEKGKFKSKSK